MTKAEATALRVKRKQQGDSSQCEHRLLSLEEVSLEEVDLRHSMERYDRMECGEPVAPQTPRIRFTVTR